MLDGLVRRPVLAQGYRVVGVDPGYRGMPIRAEGLTAGRM